MENIHKKFTNLEELKFECRSCQLGGEFQDHSDHILMFHPEFADFLFDDIDDEVSVVEATNYKFAPIVKDMKVEPDDGSKWPCTVCGFRAADKHTLRVHVEMQHLNLRFQCIVCLLNTKELYIVRGHVIKEHSNIREDVKDLHYCCGLCSFKGLKSDFLDHIKGDHPEFWVYYENHGKATSYGRRLGGQQKGKCEYCHRTFTCNLRSHVQTAHLGALYTCGQEDCGHRSKTRNRAMEHIEMKHLPDRLRSEEKGVGLEGRQWIRENVFYRCGQCDALLDRDQQLVEHMTTEHKDKIVVALEFQCKTCDMVLADKPALTEHRQLHRQPTAKLSPTLCANCDQKCSTESNLRVHIMLRHMKARFLCKVCKKQFKFPSDARTHVKKFHEEQGRGGVDCICNHCGIDPTDYEEFKAHAVAEHKMPKYEKRKGPRPESYPSPGAPGPSAPPGPAFLAPQRHCRFCGFSSRTPGAARAHMDLLHTRATHSCKMCSVKFQHKLDVMRHMRAAHEGEFGLNFVAETLLYHCAVCSIATSKEAFLLHLDSHTEAETMLVKDEVEEAANYSCTRCPAFKDDKSVTISHIIGEHMGEHDETSGVTMQQFISGLLVMNCRYCAFRGVLVDFYSHITGSLDRMATLEEATPHRDFSLPATDSCCVFCGLDCRDARGVDSHVLLVHMRAVHSCGICNIKLKSRPVMSKHMAELHSQELSANIISVQCGLCSFQSAEGVFEAHLNTAHIEEMELEAREMSRCNQCQFTAATKPQVSQHMKTVHEQFKCEHCEETFISQKKLKQHYMHFHQDWTFDCAECDYRTKHKTALQRHKITVHEKVRRFACGEDGCERSFTRREYLTLHARKDHKNRGQEVE
jgi:hypothetical protein